MKKAEEIIVGIDVSKAWLDIAVHEQEETFRASNDVASAFCDTNPRCKCRFADGDTASRPQDTLRYASHRNDTYLE